MSESGTTTGAQAVHRAIDILESFRADRASLSLAEIAEHVDLTTPTTHRLLKALQVQDLVALDPVTRRYSLGTGIMRMASVLLNRGDVLAVTQPRLLRLRELTGETVSLHWRVDAHRVCLIEAVSTQQFRMASGLGNSYPLVAGAAGLAILAFLGETDVDGVIEAEREASRAVDPGVLSRSLETVRERGYATSVGETVPGAAAIAAPILDASGRALAALNITGPRSRLTSAEMDGLAEVLLDTTREIMQQFGAGAAPLPA
ncbi:IclR family transcriptional regulator [Patulibacter sp.]|uniref:IclR family transcriptional regulator n=1 Tax=Patulibacter sp. TaxID=1912859 RepID=UPI002723BA11|nr:IclR family transcriptional regulator [Patulibacter sp.]MDO9409021.1 IclR family transcriptional regulator [Patulibacter sp.]